MSLGHEISKPPADIMMAFKPREMSWLPVMLQLLLWTSQPFDIIIHLLMTSHPMSMLPSAHGLCVTGSVKLQQEGNYVRTGTDNVSSRQQ